MVATAFRLRARAQKAAGRPLLGHWKPRCAAASNATVAARPAPAAVDANATNATNATGFPRANGKEGIGWRVGGRVIAKGDTEARGR
jgi:hypothetical protein